MNKIEEIIALQLQIKELSNNDNYFVEVKSYDPIFEVRCYKRSRSCGIEYEHYFESDIRTKDLKYHCSGIHVDDEESINEAKEFMEKWFN